MKIKLYGKLHDNTIVRVNAWIADMSFDNPENEIYFTYSFWGRLKFKNKTAWAYRKDFKGFNESKRKLRGV
jgi:hypothetical protein